MSRVGFRESSKNILTIEPPSQAVAIMGEERVLVAGKVGGGVSLGKRRVCIRSPLCAGKGVGGRRVINKKKGRT